MLKKTMKQILTKKTNQWLETITDEALVKAIKRDLVITGGCFASMIDNQSPNDFDCYFKTKDTALAVAQYYASLWNTEKEGVRVEVNVEADGRIKLFVKSQGVVGDTDAVNADEELGTAVTELDEVEVDKVVEKEKKPYYPVFISSNAITLSNGIQLICRFYGEPTEIHDTFDFEHAKAYWTYDDDVNIPVEVYELVTNKALRYTGSRYPVCSLFRLRKFISRGWTINAGQILKIALQVSDLNLQDVSVLEDQLIGVDSLYFMNLINQFKKAQEKDSNFELTTNYVVSIIDKIF